MNFDMSRAWSEATSSIGSRSALLWPIAGVFYLLPNLVSNLFMENWAQSMAPALQSAAMDPSAIFGIIGQFMGIILVMIVIQSLGSLSLLGVLTDRARPTVGEAISNAFRCLPTVLGVFVIYFVAYFVVALVIGLVLGGLYAVTGSVGLMWILGLVVLAGLVYLGVKLSLVMPVIAIDGERNPITAMSRSWALTKGNSLRIFLFYLLLAVAYFVIALVFGIVIGVIFGVSAMGAGAASVGSSSVSRFFMGLVSGLLAMAVAVIMHAILAAIHRQLSGPSSSAISETFN